MEHPFQGLNHKEVDSERCPDADHDLIRHFELQVGCDGDQAGDIQGNHCEVDQIGDVPFDFHRLDVSGDLRNRKP